MSDEFPWLKQTELTEDFYTFTPYRQPSLFQIENTREELEASTRCERFPFELESIAKEGLKQHQRNLKASTEKFCSEDMFMLKKEFDDFFYETLNKREMTQEEYDQISSDESRFNKLREEVFGEFKKYLKSYQGTEFDVHQYIADHMEKNKDRRGGGNWVIRKAKMDYGHCMSVCKHYSDQFKNRMREVKELRPWLIKFSEKYMEMFRVSFAFSGYRAIRNCEGVVFYRPDLKHSCMKDGTFKMPAEYEKQFFDAIEEIVPLGKKRRPLDDVYLDMNGCSGHLDTFLLKLNTGTMAIGYLDKGFGSSNCQGTFYISNIFPESVVKQNRLHPWSDICD